MSLSVFGFQALWSPYLMVVIVFFTVLYFLTTITWRKKFKVSEPLKKGEAVYFAIGMISLYIIKGSPIDLMAHIMFTYHMVQMAFLLLFIPLCIIKGIPWWVWKVTIEAPIIKTLFRIFTNPVVAAIIFAGMFSIYHLPAVLDFIKMDEFIHGAYTFVLFMSALLMYWPLVNTVPGQVEMKGLYKVGYIIANAVLITPACGLIIFADNPMYSTYTEGEAWLKAMELCVPSATLAGLSLTGPELFTNMSAIDDQQLGGTLMKIIQEIIFAVLLFSVFVKWYRKEQRNADDITEKSLKEYQEKMKYQ